MNEEKVVYTASDIMKLLGLSKNTTYDLLKSGQFPTRRLGKKLLVSKEAFSNWLNSD